MSQEEVTTWLENHPGWHTTGDVAEGMGVDQNNANLFLRRAYIRGTVKRREGDHSRCWEWSV